MKNKTLTAQTLYDAAKTPFAIRKAYMDNPSELEPYIDSTREQLSKDKALWAAEDYEDHYYEVVAAAEKLQEIEKRVLTSLQNNEIVAIGYDHMNRPLPGSIPHQHWFYLELDFDLGRAKGDDLDYAGLRFLICDQLKEEESRLIESVQMGISPQSDIGKSASGTSASTPSTWSNLKLRFLKNNYLEEAFGQDKSFVNLAERGLMNDTERKPNSSCEILFDMANNSVCYQPASAKHPISRLRRILKKAYGIDADPFSLDKVKGYRPKFELKDDRNALDERARKRAIHVPYNDDVNYETGSEHGSSGHAVTSSKPEYPFQEDELGTDKAAKWLKDH